MGGQVKRAQAVSRGWRWELLDWVAVAFLVAGVSAVLAGFLPSAQAGAIVHRVLPLLVFLGSVIVLAELTAKAEVFDVVAVRLARCAGGNYLALFGLCVLFASATTIFLNLDTTAVLLTPVMLATAVKAGMPPMPLAMLTVWLANTASLLLPVSNLTNLLAVDRVGLTPAEFALRMAAPQVAAVTATAVCLWAYYWRRGRRGSDRYAPPERHVPQDRVLFRTAAVACATFAGLVLLGVPLAASSLTCTGVLVVAFLVRDRAAFAWRMIPFRLLAFVTGLFLVVQTVDQYGLGNLLGALVGADQGAPGIAKAAVLGAVLSNGVNNLPAYVVGEAVVTGSDQLLGLLIATNVSPLVTPWASLAIIIWHERCRAGGVRVPWGRFAATGFVTAVVTLVAAEWALLLSL
ncbi:MAG TPA: SLC13 family permease [Pseudonocardiaceae bacterium]|jgi:arsenical pump membrane protein|nr:SLC13 family permease [Pseudonocardiaceae bacterium]